MPPYHDSLAPLLSLVCILQVPCHVCSLIPLYVPSPRCEGGKGAKGVLDREVRVLISYLQFSPGFYGLVGQQGEGGGGECGSFYEYLAFLGYDCEKGAGTKPFYEG